MLPNYFTPFTRKSPILIFEKYVVSTCLLKIKLFLFFFRIYSGLTQINKDRQDVSCNIRCDLNFSFGHISIKPNGIIIHIT